MSDIEALRRTRHDVVGECRRYVDRLRAAGKIKRSFAQDRYTWSESWEGLGFLEAGTREFRELGNYYADMVKEVTNEGLPAIARELLAKLYSDSGAYSRALSVNNVEASPFHNVPLAHIPAKEFVAAITHLSLDKDAPISRSVEAAVTPLSR